MSIKKKKGEIVFAVHPLPSRPSTTTSYFQVLKLGWAEVSGIRVPFFLSPHPTYKSWESNIWVFSFFVCLFPWAEGTSALLRVRGGRGEGGGSVALEEWQKVIIAVVGKVRGAQVWQQLVWIRQFWKQLKGRDQNCHNKVPKKTTTDIYRLIQLSLAFNS